jgi:osmoprotectant transport system ATP-binding protein
MRVVRADPFYAEVGGLDLQQRCRQNTSDTLLQIVVFRLWMMSDMSGFLDSAIEFRGVEYQLSSGKVLLSGLDVVVRRGETLMLLGRSGSGKTTCLKLINRLLVASAGEVLVESKPTCEWDPIRLRRGIGYAIQEVGLFPHYTVWENVALVPKLERWNRQRIADRVEAVLQLVGLPSHDFATRYPNQLSGGQRQRVGLARALAAEPPILLMDEPFGALDPITRSEIQTEFKKLQEKLKKTIVFVTHDVGEALMLGDRIALMEKGELRSIHTPEEFLRAQDTLAQEYVRVYRAAGEMFRN